MGQWGKQCWSDIQFHSGTYYTAVVVTWNCSLENKSTNLYITVNYEPLPKGFGEWLTTSQNLQENKGLSVELRMLVIFAAIGVIVLAQKWEGVYECPHRWQLYCVELLWFNQS